MCGLTDLPDVNNVVANTKEISQCTHADPRCTASCIAVTTVVSDRVSLGGSLMRNSLNSKD